MLPKLAGAWTGYVIGTGGGASPANLTVEPNGNYRVVMLNPDVTATGMVTVVDGQLVFTSTGRSGANQSLGITKGTADYQESPDGKMQSLSGYGTNDAGPVSITFSRKMQ